MATDVPSPEDTSEPEPRRPEPRPTVDGIQHGPSHRARRKPGRDRPEQHEEQQRKEEDEERRFPAAPEDELLAAQLVHEQTQPVRAAPRPCRFSGDGTQVRWFAAARGARHEKRGAGALLFCFRPYYL